MMLLLASGFIIYSYDHGDNIVKILNDDDYEWSEPKTSDGDNIYWEQQTQQQIKESITPEEYNKIFSDYRDGSISKEEASEKLRSSEW